jgi:hypothetical protein
MNYTVVAEVTEDGNIKEQEFSLVAANERAAVVEFVAREVYKDEWQFNFDEDVRLRIARGLATNFLARNLPSNWTVKDFEEAQFREVSKNPRTFKIVILSEGLA